MPDPNPTNNVTLNWLQELYADIDEGWLTLFTLDRTTGERRTTWHTLEDLEGVAIDADKLAPTCCVWFGVASRTDHLGTQRGGADDCDQIPALWVDLDIAGPEHAQPNLPPDIDAALALLADFPLPPTAIINSGHGLQAWWRLDDPADATTAKTVLADWGATWAELGRRRGWHVDNVFDLARVMRLPGTVNRKAEPVAVEITDVDWDRSYGLDEIGPYLIAAPEPDPAVIARRSVPYIGPERPGDAFNAVTSGHDLLVGYGFHVDKTDRDGKQHYRAPHRSGRNEQTGATVYPDDGHITIWSETYAAQHGLRTQRPYDPFGFYTHVEHNGDWGAATRALRAEGFGSPDIVDLEWIGAAGTAVAPAAVDASPSVDAEQIAPPALEIRWVDDLDRHAMPPEPPVLVDGLLRRGEMCVFGAPRAIGKTWLAYNLAIGLARGEGQFLGNLKVERVANVLYLQGELDQWGSAVRWKLLTGATSPLPHVAETFDRVRFRTVKRRTSRQSASGLVTEEYIDAHIDDRIEAAIVENDIDVVIVDPWAVFLAGAENSNDEVEAVLGQLREITLRTGVAWVIIHHITGKAERSSWTEPEDLWRGATRLADWASTRVTVLPHYTEAQYKEKGMTRGEARRHANVHFLRRSTPTDDFTMRLDQGWWVAWRPEDEPPGTTPTLELARRLLDAGGEVGSIRDVARLMDMSPTTATQLVTDAARAGLVVVTEGPNRAKVIRLAEDLEHPWAPRVGIAKSLESGVQSVSSWEADGGNGHTLDTRESVPEQGERPDDKCPVSSWCPEDVDTAKAQVKCGAPVVSSTPSPTERGPVDTDPTPRGDGGDETVRPSDEDVTQAIGAHLSTPNGTEPTTVGEQEDGSWLF